MGTGWKTSLFLLLLFAGYVAARAGNVLTIASAEGTPGEVVRIDVSLSHADAVSALQLRIPLGDCAAYVPASAALSTERTDGHTIAANQADGVLSVMVYSGSMNALKGREGKLLSVDLEIKSTPGVFALHASEAMLVDAAGQVLPADVSAGTLTVVAPQSQYSTYSIDFGRVALQSSYTKEVTVVNSGTADLVIEDLVFSDASLTSTASMPMRVEAGKSARLPVVYAPVRRGAAKYTMRVVSNTTTVRNSIEIQAAPYAVNELLPQNASGASDSEVEIALRVKNMDALCGFQFQFTLPQELQYVEGSFRLSSRANGHSAMAGLTNGVLHLMAYSATNSPFVGNDGVIATFNVKLRGSHGCTLRASECILTSMLDGVPTNVTSAHSAAWVEIRSPKINGNAGLSLGRQPLTGLASVPYLVGNRGKETLVIDRVICDNEALAVDCQLPMTIEPGKSSEMTVRYATDRAGEYAGNLLIYSNDPDARLKKVALTGVIYSPNFLSMEASGVNAVDVVLSNHDAVEGLQFDFTYPAEYFVLDEANVVMKNAMKDYAVTSRRVADGHYRLFAYSFADNPVVPDTASVMTITLTPKPEIESRYYGVAISEAVLSSPGMEDVASAATASGTVLHCRPGDANGDGTVNVGDIATISNWILGRPQTNFWWIAADVNEDKLVNVGDISKVARIILLEER